MSSVYILNKNGTGIIAFDATTKTDYTRRNNLTKSSVMSGAQVSDGYTIGAKVISFSGVVSYSKIRNETPTPEMLQVYIDEVINSQTRFTFNGNKLIPSLDDCVIIASDVNHDRFSDAVTTSITVEQVFVTKTAVTTTLILAPSSTTNGELADKKENGSGAKTEVPKSKSKTLFKRAADNGIDFGTYIFGTEGNTNDS